MKSKKDRAQSDLTQFSLGKRKLDAYDILHDKFGMSREEVEADIAKRQEAKR